MEYFVKKADGLHRPFFVLPVIAASEKFIYGKATSHHRAGEDHLRQGCQPSPRRRHQLRHRSPASFRQPTHLREADRL